MKRIWGLLLFLMLLLLFSAALADVEINEKVFPDEGFRKYILDAGFDRNGDGRLSKAEIAEVTVIDCHSREIRSLQGISTFTELVDLQCYNNQLTEINVSKNKKLASLGAYQNRLTKVNLSKNKKLVSFSCSGNPLSELVLPNNRDLTWLDLTGTDLKQLDIGQYPLLEQLVRASAPTPYIYGETEEQINWVSDTSFLAVDREITLTAGGAVLYDGSGSAQAETEKAGANEAPAETAEKQDQAESAADTSGKVQIARLMKPDFKGKFNTLWMSVPDHYTLTIVHENNTPLMSVPEDASTVVAGVILESERKKDQCIIKIQIITMGEWMEYRNLNEFPEDTLNEAVDRYCEWCGRAPGDTSKLDWYEFPSGLKMLRDRASRSHFYVWTMFYGYDITVDEWINQTHKGASVPLPSAEDMQVVETVINSLEIREE